MMKILLIVVVVAAALTGACVAEAAISAAAGTRTASQHTEPLLVDAETTYSALADADATAASAFLAGGLEPPALTDRYNDDIKRANTALAEAATRTPAGSAAAGRVAALTAGVSRYAGLVATARANNRQGFPVGAAYLSAASDLNRTELLPQADALLHSADDDLTASYTAARADAAIVLMFLVLAGLFAALLYLQRYLSRRTRRTFNVPLVIATIATAVLGLWAAGTFTVEHHHLTAARVHGSDPVDTLAQARILALQERGDEGLTLAARGSGGAYETDFQTTRGKLVGPHGLLDTAARQVDGAARTDVRAAAQAEQSYVAAHTQVRKLDDAGASGDAVALATGPQTTATYTSLTEHLGRALDAKKATFATEIAAAGSGLGLLALAGPTLALIVCGLAFLGVRARLEEYR